MEKIPLPPFFSYIALNRDGNLSWERSLSLTLSPSHSHFIFSESTISNPLAFVRRSIQVSFFFLSLHVTQSPCCKGGVHRFSRQRVFVHEIDVEKGLSLCTFVMTRRREKKTFFQLTENKTRYSPSLLYQRGAVKERARQKIPMKAELRFFCSSLRSGVN